MALTGYSIKEKKHVELTGPFTHKIMKNGVYMIKGLGPDGSKICVIKKAADGVVLVEELKSVAE